MPIPVVCESCRSKLNAPDAAAGKTLKCPKCKASLTVPAAAAPQFEVMDDEEEAPKPARKKAAAEDEEPAKKRPVIVDDDEEDEKPRKKKPVVVDDEDEDEQPRKKKPVIVDDEDVEEKPKKKKKKKVVVDDEDEDDDDRPKKKKKKKLVSAVDSGNMARNIIGGVVLLIALGFLAYVWWDRGREKDGDKQGKNEDEQPRFTPAPPGQGPGPRPGPSSGAQSIDGEYLLTGIYSTDVGNIDGEKVKQIPLEGRVFDFKNGEVYSGVEKKTLFMKFTIDPTQSPAHLNATINGKVQYGIYKLENGKLTIYMMDHPGQEAERPRFFSVVKGYGMMTFERRQASTPPSPPSPPQQNWVPLEANGFRVQFPSRPEKLESLDQLFAVNKVKGGAYSVRGLNETFVFVYFTPDPGWSPEMRAQELRILKGAIFSDPVTSTRKVMMAGKEWEENTLSSKGILIMGTQRILDTGSQIIILHATYSQGKTANRDKFLDSFEFVK